MEFKGQSAFLKVRNILGVPVNCSESWGKNAYNYIKDLDLQCTNILFDFNDNENIKYENVVENAIVGCISGIGVCDNYGALTSLFLIKDNSDIEVFYVSTGNHNFAAYKFNNKYYYVDPWRYETYNEKEEILKYDCKKITEDYIIEFNNKYDEIKNKFNDFIQNNSENLQNYINDNNIQSRRQINSPLI